MTSPTNGTSNLDGWIREHSFRVAYSDATKGFIGKKALREVLCSIVPSELGYTAEQVRARLAIMLAKDLTPDLLRECDARRKTPSVGAGGGGGGGAGVVVATTPGSAVVVVPTEARRDRDAKLGGAGPSPRVLDKGKQRAVDPVDVMERGKGERAKLSALASGSAGRKAAAASATGHAAPLVGSRGGEVTKAGGGGLATRLAARLSGLGTAAAGGGGGSGLGAAGGRGYSSVEESVESTTTVMSSSLVSASVNHSVRAPTSESGVPLLPFKLQYRIFTALQAILEGCCFSFAQKNYPAYLVRKAWDCPEAGELTAWTRGLTREFYSNPVFDMSEEEFELILKKGGDIRHAAVHRVPVSAEEIQRLIEDARAMAELLDDGDRMTEILEIKTVVERNVQVLLERRRTKVENLRQKLEELENLKRDIELRETLALKGAEQEEEVITRSFQDDIGRELEWLGLEGKGIGVRDRTGQEGSGNGSDGEDGGGGGDGPLLTIAEHEEAFHEPEGWPAGGGGGVTGEGEEVRFTAEELAAVAESISNLSG